MCNVHAYAYLVFFIYVPSTTYNKFLFFVLGHTWHTVWCVHVPSVFSLFSPRAEVFKCQESEDNALPSVPCIKKRMDVQNKKIKIK